MILSDLLKPPENEQPALRFFAFADGKYSATKTSSTVLRPQQRRVERQGAKVTVLRQGLAEAIVGPTVVLPRMDVALMCRAGDRVPWVMVEGKMDDEKKGRLLSNQGRLVRRTNPARPRAPRTSWSSDADKAGNHAVVLKPLGWACSAPLGGCNSGWACGSVVFSGAQRRSASPRRRTSEPR